MKIIAFDTTNSLCSVALFDNGDVRSFKTTTEPSQQAESLIQFIEQLLEENNLSYTQLDGLALTIGPGSFTGIRVGLAAAKGLQLTTNLPVIAITNLELSAWAVYQNNDRNLAQNIRVYLNARLDRLYTQTFNSQLEPLDEARLIKIEQATIDSNIDLTGDGVPLLNKSDVGLYSPPIDAQLLAQSLNFFAPKRFSHTLTPLYIRDANITTPKS